MFVLQLFPPQLFVPQLLTPHEFANAINSSISDISIISTSGLVYSTKYIVFQPPFHPLFVLHAFTEQLFGPQEFVPQLLALQLFGLQV